LSHYVRTSTQLGHLPELDVVKLAFKHAHCVMHDVILQPVLMAGWGP